MCDVHEMLLHQLRVGCWLQGVRAGVDSEAFQREDLRAELEQLHADSRAPPSGTGADASREEAARLAQQADRAAAANQAHQRRVDAKVLEFHLLCACQSVS